MCLIHADHVVENRIDIISSSFVTSTSSLKARALAPDFVLFERSRDCLKEVLRRDLLVEFPCHNHKKISSKKK